MKLGDAVETLAKPIAIALKMDCLDEHQNLKPESPCAKRKAFLNKLTMSQNPMPPKLTNPARPQFLFKPSDNGGWQVSVIVAGVERSLFTYATDEAMLADVPRITKRPEPDANK